MCCALNSETADENSVYALLMKEMQDKGEKVQKVPISIGKNSGLKIILDLHSNQASFGSITEDFNSFQVFIGGSSEFPSLKERNLQLEPGQEHFLDLSAQVLERCKL